MRATDYDEVKKKLKKMGIKVIPGPLTTDRAGRIASEILQAGYDSILADNLRSKTVEDPPKSYKRCGVFAVNNDPIEWRNVIASSKEDVDLASEAFCKGFAFLTNDSKFGRYFGSELDKRKMAMHVVPTSWLEPPELPIGSAS
ncbi:hypothetical protein ABW21_db0202109 [Orbilia brochopaga]|nr:hypothetical protein ABW21_db0202109 [Drechslerella brochopaga]